MAFIIAVIQQKGGVGKSTICANLVGELAAQRRAVVALDLDVQRTLTDWAETGRGGALRQLVRPVEFAGAEKVKTFRQALDAAQAAAEVVFLDCPAGVNDTAMLAALNADLALIPVTPSPADLLALRESISLLHETQRARAGKPIIALVPSRLSRTTLGAMLPTSLAETGERVLPGIGQRVAYAQSILSGLTIREFLPTTAPEVIEFSALAAEVMNLTRPA